jgi:6-phosphogluconolactonase
VACFRIEAGTGALSLLAEAPVEESTPYLTADHAGRHLFGAAYQGDMVWVGDVDADGRLAPLPHKAIGRGKSPHHVCLSADDRIAYVAFCGEDTIKQFGFDPRTGALTPKDELTLRVEEGSRPRHLVLHTDLPVLYCIDEWAPRVNVYRIDPKTGALSPDGRGELGQAPGTSEAPHLCADLHMTPDRRFLYGSERKTSTISGFAVDPKSGALSRVETIVTEKSPRTFAIDPTGAFLIAAGQDSDHVSVYAIDRESGRLTLVARQASGACPSWVEVVAPGG